jgi:hypothetical protein
MHYKNIIFNFLILTSTLTYCINEIFNVDQQKELLYSLYGQDIDLFGLNPDTIAHDIQTLKEEKAILKRIIEYETGFFKNFDIVKGILGLWLVAKLFFSSITPILILVAYNEVGAKSRKELLIKRPIEIFITSMITVFSLWLIKISVANLYRGWYKKEHALKDLAKREKLLDQLENIRKYFILCK